MRERRTTSVSGVLVEGAEEVTDKMIVEDIDMTAFGPVTLEMSSFDIGAECAIFALVDDLMARGFLASMAGDIAASVRERVYGGSTKEQA